MESMSRAAERCRVLGGVATAAELAASGETARTVRAAVEAGELERVRAGTFLLAGVPPVVRAAVRHRGRLACVSAARRLGLWVLDDGEREPVHFWMPSHLNGRVDETRAACDERSATEVRCRCVSHRRRLLAPPDPLAVGAVDALLEIHACKGADAFFASLESALHRGLLGDVERARLSDALPEHGRWLVGLARTDAESGLESILRLRLHRHGLTLSSQVEIGGVGRVDFVVGDCLILEADGGSHDGSGRHRDRTRDAVAMSLGFVTLRFDTAQILHEWPLVEAAVLAAIDRGLHRTEPRRPSSRPRPVR